MSRIAFLTVLLFILIQPMAILHGEEPKREQVRFVTPKTGDPLYVLDRWAGLWPILS